MITKAMREQLYERSGMACEAMVATKSGVYARCWAKPVEVHHLLTRARGGGILDQAGETYHLICLCNKHHQMSDGGDAYEGGLLIDGYVMTGPRGRPIYHGSDIELTERYGR